jgi:hypothetical protein
MGVAISVLRRRDESIARDRRKTANAGSVPAQTPAVVKPIRKCCYCKKSFENSVEQAWHLCEGMKLGMYR